MSVKNFFNSFIKNERNILLYTIIFSLLILSILPILRVSFHNSIIPGQEPYYNARMGEQVFKNPTLEEDSLTKESYHFNIYHFLIGAISKYSNLTIASMLIPFILGILSPLLLYFILKKLSINKLTRFIAINFFIISTPFIKTFSYSTISSLSTFIILLGIFIYLSENKILSYFSSIIFISLSYVSYNAMIFSAILILGLIPFYKRKRNFNILLSLILFILFILLKGTLNYSSNFWNYIFSDFANSFGLSFFMLLLSAIGIYICWRVKKHIFSYLMLASLFVLIFYSKDFIPLLNVIISIFAAYGFTSLLVMKWKVSTLKMITLPIILMSIIFSSLFFVIDISSDKPNKDIIDSLIFLSDKTDKNNILSSQQNSLWIQTLANSNTILDYNEIIPKDINNLFYTRNLEDAKEYIKSYNITYIYITPEMKRGVIWTKENQGLLFLFRNQEFFTNIYNKNQIEIWKINTLSN